jgi:tetratricopeptide (TPR) repeat protein
MVRSAAAGSDEFTRGVAAATAGDHATAAKAFELARDKAPGVPEVRINLALTYLRLGRAADAATELEHAATLAPDDARVQFQLGGAYAEMQTLDKASAAIERGLAKRSDMADPLTYEAVVTLGAIYFAKGENDKAAAQYERALAVRPSAAASLGLGKVHFSKGDVDQALKCFEQVVTAHSGTPEAKQAEMFIKELRKGHTGGSL